jgi:hypothetical protein
MQSSRCGTSDDSWVAKPEAPCGPAGSDRDDRNVAIAITRAQAAQGQKQSCRADAAPFGSGRKEQRAIRRSVPIVATLGRASTPRADYCFDQGASTEAARTRCAFVAKLGSLASRAASPAFAFRRASAAAAPRALLSMKRGTPRRSSSATGDRRSRRAPLVAKLGSLASRAASPAFAFRRASAAAAPRDCLCPIAASSCERPRRDLA